MMLIQIGTREKTVSTDNAIDALLECHERIRYFMRMAQQIASGKSPDSEIAEGAREVYRYFTEALPLHSDDEDRSLLPRINSHTAELDSQLLEMEAQHTEIEKTMQSLRPLWREIAENPAARQKHSSALVSQTDHLQSLWGIHLKLEETLIFPAASRFLTAADHASIRGEMRERRS